MSELEGIVFLVDDDASVRKAAARLFRSAGMSIETFATAEDFLDFVRPDRPSCLVLDVHMPRIDGIELQEQLAEHHADLPIIFMTGHGDIPMSVKAIKAGAVDFLPKPVDDQRLLQSVEQALISHARSRQQRSEINEIRNRFHSLTSREYDVMELVLTGMLNKQIAKKLEITVATVKVHRGRVMKKINVTSVAELIRLSERAGIS